MSNLKQRQDHIIPDLSKPSVKGLAYLLRHKELWPKNFGPWNYSRVCECGIGLAAAQWDVSALGVSIGVAFGMDGADAHRIFYGLSGDMPYIPVTPEQVAEHLEAL